MSRIVEVGPFARHIPDSQWGEYYSERRSLDRMESEILQHRGFPFSFEKQIRLLHLKVFPGVETLEILDAGCGEGRALWDFRQIATKLGIKVRTTGITMDREHLKGDGSDQDVDEKVFGTVQNFFVKEGKSITEKYHFILDYHGALEGDLEHETYKGGKTIIPIYGKMLVPGGVALLTPHNLDLALLQENDLRIIWANSYYIFAQRGQEFKTADQILKDRIAAWREHRKYETLG